MVERERNFYDVVGEDDDRKESDWSRLEGYASRLAPLFVVGAIDPRMFLAGLGWAAALRFKKGEDGWKINFRGIDRPLTPKSSNPSRYQHTHLPEHDFGIFSNYVITRGPFRTVIKQNYNFRPGLKGHYLVKEYVLKKGKFRHHNSMSFQSVGRGNMRIFTRSRSIDLPRAMICIDRNPFLDRFGDNEDVEFVGHMPIEYPISDELSRDSLEQ